VTQPQAFGRYELLSRLTGGGMAEVFRARDTQRGTIVALKRILPNVAKDEDFIQMFEDEARIASQLEHPHIARTLDFGHVGTTYFIAFEFVDGKDLRAVFDHCVRAKEAPPLWFLIYVFTRICEGLSYAHSRKDAGGSPVLIVHRDVSPQNIVVSFGGDVKLIDFGIAKAAGKLSRTEVGAIKGKFGYMSPEQIGGGLVDQRTDVFSLGICMWELLTRTRLYDAPNEILVLEKIRRGIIQPPSSLNALIPPGLDRIVCKALAKDMDERYGSAKDLYRDLNALSKDTNTVATREQIAQYMRRTFPEAGRPPGGRDGEDLADARTPSAVRVQEVMMETQMAADNKGGSDLDVFEGLGKKNTGRPPAGALGGQSPAAPPSTVRNGGPPSSAPRSAPPPPPPARGASDAPPASLRGLASSPPASVPGMRVSAPAPPPPPGRAALPPVVAPPSRTASSSFPVAAPTTKPVAPEGAKLDMDWDDENEATHVYDKEGSSAEPAPQPPATAAAPATVPGSLPPLQPPAPKTQPMGVGSAPVPGMKRTLVGIQSPFQAPPPPPPPPGPPGSMAPPAFRAGSVPPPPSSVGGAFARASSIASAAPGPVAYPPPAPPPSLDAGPSQPPMLAAPPPSTYKSAPPPYLPPQVNTLPMAMPGPRPATPISHMPDMPPPPMANRMEATALLHPPERSRTGLVVGAVTALVVVAAGAFFLMPRRGEVVVSATDSKGDVSHIEVYVDGKKTECGTSPCVVGDVVSGTHTVKVVAEGYGTIPEQLVNVVSRQQSRAAFGLATSAEAPSTGVKVGGAQVGVKLYIDDKEIGAVPAEVRDLTPGSHRVRIAGGERYAAVEKNVTVAKDEFQDLGTVNLKVVKGKATITPGNPTGAKVYIVSGADRRELPTLPISVDIDTSKQWSLLATKLGYGDYTQPISFDDGQAEKTFVINLDVKQAVAAQPQVPQEAPPPYQPPAPAPPRPAARPQQPPANTTSSSGGGDTAPSGGEAFLNINSIPASSIVLDGKPIGNTPKLKYSVSAGSHTVLFVNTEQSFKKTVTVNVGAGETKAAIGKGD